MYDGEVDNVDTVTLTTEHVDSKYWAVYVSISRRGQPDIEITLHGAGRDPITINVCA